MLQWNYEQKTFDARTTKLLPDLNGDPRRKPQKLLQHLNGDPRSKTQKPKSQISCYNGTMNINLLTLSPQNFYQASMMTLEATPKTQISNLMLQWNYEHKTFTTLQW